jgi:hypothetical protein
MLYLVQGRSAQAIDVLEEGPVIARLWTTRRQSRPPQ